MTTDQGQEATPFTDDEADPKPLSGAEAIPAPEPAAVPEADEDDARSTHPPPPEDEPSGQGGAA